MLQYQIVVLLQDQYMSHSVLHWGLKNTDVIRRHVFLIWRIIDILVVVLIILYRLKVIFNQFQFTVVFHIQICKLQKFDCALE